MERIQIQENNIQMVLEKTRENKVKLLHFSVLPFTEDTIRDDYEKAGFRLVELALSGVDRPEERHGSKYTVTGPGYRMTYVSHTDTRNEKGRLLEVVTRDEETEVYVTSCFQFFDGIPVVRAHSIVENKGQETQGLEYVSSFNLNGLGKEGILPRDEKLRVSVMHNSWHRELQWKEYTLPELGLEQCQIHQPTRSSKALQVTNTGNWSTKEYLPMGCVTNRETGTNLFWQIEHNGSWHWEISDQTNHLYLQLSGPTQNQSHWYKELKPGERFESVPVAVGSVAGELDEVAAELTKYRRRIRRQNADNEQLAVIFNDYMNCLFAEPTTAKELPLIDQAAACGCEYYCIDAGWYSAGYWWDGVGEWLPSKERFPGGIEEVIDYIRQKGMVPGLWLELEVMGIKCKLAGELPDECFFIRHGRRVSDRSRYQLDFRHPLAIKHATEVVKRLINTYGIGYIKMDYNIEPGIGTEVAADSYGEGLLEHERAYLRWLDEMFAMFPELIIENCSSGGLRMDYAMLSRHSIQSTSDQEDFRLYATIAANSPLGVTMEQAAVWSYPQVDSTEEETAFNMVNAMLMRIHQSGHLAKLSEANYSLVKEGIAYYKSIRQEIKEALPFWPLGVSSFADDHVSVGLKSQGKTYVALWRRGGPEEIKLPLKHLKGQEVEVCCAYPSNLPCTYQWNALTGLLSVKIPAAPGARLFELKEK
ncbi:glycoside hydrolase family 36 protein [Ohessyouella blattaphilus]|uniref:Alpha-galactosidase n=1 Tax=Ohessyouella blattaphilus TaxID=2949333 RepID=A0ABT1EKK8_9FIRM|nr:glycoside hydrolase family 36 protein [Ohessyouella blattaphilus]MCP1110292.1 alpha-galactosidase [Ohessyouella blattaphilus]MCR8563686.1 alpha-galactosidase [Ohessyouella blattaphilus]